MRQFAIYYLCETTVSEAKQRSTTLITGWKVVKLDISKDQWKEFGIYAKTFNDISFQLSKYLFLQTIQVAN
jgi:hypothetical protein